MRDSLVQQIGCLRQIPSFISVVAPRQNEIFGATIKIERGDIGGGWALDCHLLSG